MTAAMRIRKRRQPCLRGRGGWLGRKKGRLRVSSSCTVSWGEESEHTTQGGVSVQRGTHVTWGNHRRDVVGDGEK